MIVRVLFDKWSKIEPAIMYNAEHENNVVKDQILKLRLSRFVDQDGKQGIENIIQLLYYLNLWDKDELLKQIHELHGRLVLPID